MLNSFDRVTRAGRRRTVLGAATLIAGVALAPVAGADEAPSGTLADALLQAVSTASASGSGEAGQGDGQQATGPTVTVSQTVISPEGEHTITVTGTGFTGDALGTRPPLAGTYPGSYVVLGAFADEWKPSEGAASSVRKPVITQKWAVLAEDMQAIGGEAAGAIPMSADGSFTATFAVSKALVDEKAGDAAGNLGIYTYAGSGATVAEWETFTPLSFGEPATDDSAPGLFGSLTGLLQIF